MKKSWFFIVLILSIVMVNPPIVYWVNDYCVAHPMTFGWPTMYWWLQFWYAVMIIDFALAAWKLKEWDCHQDKTPIVPVKREE